MLIKQSVNTQAVANFTGLDYNNVKQAMKPFPVHVCNISEVRKDLRTLGFTQACTNATAPQFLCRLTVLPNAIRAKQERVVSRLFVMPADWLFLDQKHYGETLHKKKETAREMKTELQDIILTLQKFQTLLESDPILQLLSEMTLSRTTKAA